MEYSTLLKNARDIDSKKGIVSFYFADFNSVDTHGRRMHKNAFNRTFKNNFKRFKHLLNHDLNTIIGKPMEVGTDVNGAFMVSQMSKTDKGRETLQLYEEGIYNEHSFGFVIKDSQQDKDIEVVNELQMFEASTVTFGANENTPVISLNEYETRLKTLEEFNVTLNTKLDAIMARLPVSAHQAPQKSDDELTEVLTFLNTNY